MGSEMAVKSLAELQREARSPLRSLADLQTEAGSERARGLRDPIFGRMMPYRIDLSGTPFRGAFLEEKDREVFDQLGEFYAPVSGMRFGRTAEDKLEAFYILDMGLPPLVATQHKDLVSQTLFGEKLGTETIGQRIRQNYRNGQIQVQLADLGMQVLMGQDTPGTWQEIDRLRKALGTDFRAAFRPWYEKMVSSSAEQIPLMAEGIQAAPWGAGAGMAIGGLMGTAAGLASPTIGEEALIPAMAWSGAKIGGGMAMAYRIGQLEAGGALLDLLDMGIDPNIAKATSVGIGALNGALETAQIGTLLRTLPGGKALASKSISAIVNKLVREGTLRNLAARHVAQYGAFLTEQTAQELAQESVNLVGEEFDKYLMEQTRGLDIPPATLAEISARYKEIAAKSVQGFSLMGLPGTVLSAGVDVYGLRAGHVHAADQLMPDGRATEIPISIPEKGADYAVSREGQGPQGRPEVAEAGAAGAQPAAPAAPGAGPGGPAAAGGGAAVVSPVAGGAPAAAPGAVSRDLLESALGQESVAGLLAKAREIGVAVRGKKAQMAAFIADAIAMKAGTHKRMQFERDELKATIQAIKNHPVYQVMVEAGQYQEADIESGLEGRTRSGRVNPDRVYFVEPRYRSEVESVTGEEGEEGYNEAMAERITFEKGKGQSWDDAVQEQQLDLDLSGFLESLRAAVEASEVDKAGIYPWAVERALEQRTEDPSLEMLVEKRRGLEAKVSPYEINEAIHKIGARYGLTKEQYGSLLLAEDKLVDVDDPHPGSLTFEEFFERLGRELGERQSTWLQRWNAPVREKPRQMYQRLRAEWEALAATGLADRLTVGQVLAPEPELTAQQKGELQKIDAEKVATDILKRQKEIIIGRLIGGLLDDAAEVKTLRLALKRAYRAGEKEGIAKARQEYRLAQQKLRADERLREHIGKLLRYIKKPAGATLAMEARRAIALIQASIDPHFRAKSTIDTRRAAREYFAQHPDVWVPEKVLERIQSRSPSEMTVAELQEVAQQVRALRHKGRTLQKLIETAKDNRRAEDRNTFLEAIGREHWAPLETGPITKAEREPFGRRVRNLVDLTLTPERFLDKLEGGKGFAGSIFRLMWDTVATKASEKIRMTHSRWDAVEAKLKSLGVTRTDLTQTAITVNGKEYSGQEAVGVYNFMRNISSRLAITFGNRIAIADQSRIAHFVEEEAPALKELADWMIEFYDERYEPMRQATIEAFGMDPGREENYTPMRRMEVDFVPDERQIREELEARFHLKKAIVEHGFAIMRKDIPEQHQKPIRLDSMMLLYEQIEREEHEIAFAVLVRRMNELIYDPQVKTAVLNKLGRSGWERLKNYIDAVANPNIYRTYHDLERMVATLRSHAAIAYLAGKLSTMLLQPVSVMLYLPEAGHHLFISAWKTVADWEGVRQFVVEKDPLMDSPVLEREFEELREKDAKIKSALRTIGEWGLKPLTAFDAVGRTIGWYGTYLHQYDRLIREGKTNEEAEAEAARVARHTTTRSQPGARAFELAEMYRTSVWVNVIQQFTQQLNRQWNMTVYDLPAAWKNAQYQQAAAIFAGLGINAILVWTIQNGRLPEDDEDLMEAFSDQFITQIPFIGLAWIAYEEGFGGGAGVPAIEGAAQLASNTVKVGRSLIRGDFDEKALSKAIEGLAPVIGMPWSGPKRIVAAIRTGNPWELLGRPKPKKPKRRKGKSIASR